MYIAKRDGVKIGRSEDLEVLISECEPPFTIFKDEESEVWIDSDPIKMIVVALNSDVLGSPYSVINATKVGDDQIEVTFADQRTVRLQIVK